MNTKQEAKPKVSDFNRNATKNDLYLDHSDNSSPEDLGTATRSLDPELLNNPQNNCFDSDLHKSHGKVAERQDMKSSQTPQLYDLIPNMQFEAEVEFPKRTINYWDPDLKKYTSLDLHEACEKFNMLGWTNTILADTPWPLETKDVTSKRDNLLKLSLETESKLAITPITTINRSQLSNDLEPLKDSVQEFGVIAKEYIKKSSMLIYAGKLSIITDCAKDAYVISDSDIKNDSMVLSAKQYGNIGRFINHAPTAEDIDKYIKFATPKIKDSVAFANFKTLPTSTPKGDMFVLVANRDIEPGEHIYFDYGLYYFEIMGFPPALFTKNGSLIDNSKYKWFNPSISIKINDSTQINEKTYFVTHSKLNIKDSSNRCENSLTDLISSERIILIAAKPTEHKKNLFIHPYFFLHLLNTTDILSRTNYAIIDLPKDDNPYLKYTDSEDLNKEMLNKLAEILQLPETSKHSLKTSNIILNIDKVKNEINSHPLYPQTKVLFWQFASAILPMSQKEAESILEQNDIEFYLTIIDKKTYFLVRFSSLFKSLNTRLFSKLAVESEVRDDSELKTGVYESAHEDSITESTQKFASANTFFANRQSCKEQNAPNNLYDDNDFDKVKPQI